VSTGLPPDALVGAVLPTSLDERDLLHRGRAGGSMDQRVAIFRIALPAGLVLISRLILSDRLTSNNDVYKGLLLHMQTSTMCTLRCYNRFVIISAGRRCLYWRQECKQSNSNRNKYHNVLWTILPVRSVHHGLR
jgi:hypothetical protein